jgi:hypothetical protein
LDNTNTYKSVGVFLFYKGGKIVEKRDILRYETFSGRRIKEDGNVVNIADMIEALHKALVVNKDAGVQLNGSNGVKANVDATGSLQVKIAGADDTSSGALNVKLADSGIILPVDVQTRYPQTIQTHNAVSVSASAFSNGTWALCEGFDKIAITVLNDAAVSSEVIIQYSNDGVNLHGSEYFGATSLKEKKHLSEIGAKWFRIVLNNKDAATHTMSAWAYLKA